MRYSKAFLPTVKEAPKDATMPSHVLLLRAGYARMVGAGLYEMLPLGLRVLHKVSDIVRAEMDAAGAQEVLMPALLPADYFKETDRWDGFGDTLFRLQDRRGQPYHLGPTHEEIFTDLVRREVKSYRQLPLNLYQIQAKYRDEPRPRGGLLRGREFLMKDAYSFDASEEGALASYESMRDAYHRIFSRLGLTYRVVRADSGAMGGSTSAEFQVLTQTGEDALVACAACEYAANAEIAEARAPGSSDAPDPATLEPVGTVATPNVKTIDEVVEFIGGDLTAARTLKSLVYALDDEVVLVVVRGDRAVNETRLARHLGVPAVVLASDATVERAFGALPGSVGPVGFSGRIVADLEVPFVVNAVAGANEADHHYTNVNYGRDFQAELASIRQVVGGDACPSCGEPLEAYRGIEGGHIFILGTRYSQQMGATFLDEVGEAQPAIMGCYGIGISRLMASAVEQHHDADGICWPMPIAPYHVIVSPVGKDDAVAAAAEDVYRALTEAGIEALLDDRDERPGVKFKDADLIGIPQIPE